MSVCDVAADPRGHLLRSQSHEAMKARPRLFMAVMTNGVSVVHCHSADANDYRLFVRVIGKYR